MNQYDSEDGFDWYPWLRDVPYRAYEGDLRVSAGDMGDYVGNIGLALNAKYLIHADSQVCAVAFVALLARYLPCHCGRLVHGYACSVLDTRAARFPRLNIF